MSNQALTDDQIDDVVQSVFEHLRMKSPDIKCILISPLNFDHVELGYLSEDMNYVRIAEHDAMTGQKVAIKTGRRMEKHVNVVLVNELCNEPSTSLLVDDAAQASVHKAVDGRTIAYLDPVERLLNVCNDGASLRSYPFSAVTWIETVCDSDGGASLSVADQPICKYRYHVDVVINGSPTITAGRYECEAKERIAKNSARLDAEWVAAYLRGAMIETMKVPHQSRGGRKQHGWDDDLGGGAGILAPLPRPPIGPRVIRNANDPPEE